MFSSEETRLRLIQKFWEETYRNLNALRHNLTRLHELETREVIRTMFLAAHTIKGNLGMMQLLDLELFDLHAPASDLEAVLLSLRDQEINLDDTVIRKVETCLAQLESQLATTQEELR